MIDTDGSIVTLIIRRLQCANCRKIHHELPDMLVPYKRHGAETIERIIENESDSTCCEDSTIRKIKAWWAAMLLFFQSVPELEKCKTSLSSPIKLRAAVRAAANARLWQHTRSTCLSG
jgi:hypothetical protein